MSQFLTRHTVLDSEAGTLNCNVLAEQKQLLQATTRGCPEQTVLQRLDQFEEIPSTSLTAVYLFHRRGTADISVF